MVLRMGLSKDPVKPRLGLSVRTADLTTAVPPTEHCTMIGTCSDMSNLLPLAQSLSLDQPTECADAMQHDLCRTIITGQSNRDIHRVHVNHNPEFTPLNGFVPGLTISYDSSVTRVGAVMHDSCREGSGLLAVGTMLTHGAPVSTLRVPSATDAHAEAWHSTRRGTFSVLPTVLLCAASTTAAAAFLFLVLYVWARIGRRRDLIRSEAASERVTASVTTGAHFRGIWSKSVSHMPRKLN